MKHTILYTAVVSALLLLCGCTEDATRVLITTASGDTVSLAVAVARTPDQRNLGLMYRTSLPKERGMLFLFDEDKMQRFTMKNTYIPLDIIFIDRSKKIIGWAENTTPFSKGPYRSEAPCRYVLEANAFFCKDNNVAKGDTVRFQGIYE